MGGNWQCEARQPYFSYRCGARPAKGLRPQAIASFARGEAAFFSGVLDNPHTWLTDVLTKLINRWPARRIDELMPWAYAAPATL